MTNNQLTDKRQEHGTSALTIGYYMCRCPECGWFGSSEDIHGDHEICDCPNCSTEVEDLDVGSLWNLVLPKLAELQERRKAERDSEPVVYASEETLAYAAHGELLLRVLSQPAGEAIIPLYRHAQQPVVPDDYQRLRELYHAQEKRLFKIAQRIKGPAFDKYSHSPSQAIDVLEVAIFGENDACRAAMLNHPSSIQPNTDAATGTEIKHPSSNSPVIPGEWIPVSERMPGSQEWVIVFAKWANQQVLCWDDVQNRWTDFEDQSYYADMFTHWMPLPAAPQEVKGE